MGMDKGIIGFFDILGYQSFLENSPGDASRQVVSKLVSLKQAMADEMRQAFSHEQDKPKVEELVGLLNWLVFSDTILLYSQFDGSDSPGKRSNRWIVMNFACLLLWRRMFEYGLPLRGVVHTGEFLVQGTCFAGRAIVEAYRLSQDLNLSACAYSRAAFSALLRQANEPHDPLLWNWIPAWLFEYQLPRKKSSPERRVTINPLAIFLESYETYFKGDIRQIVHESFWKHDKDILETARAKVQNTEQFLRACRFAIENLDESAKRMRRFEKKPEQPAS